MATGLVLFTTKIENHIKVTFFKKILKSVQRWYLEVISVKLGKKVNRGKIALSFSIKDNKILHASLNFKFWILVF